MTLLDHSQTDSPSRTSTAISLVLTLSGVVLFLREVPSLHRPVLFGIGGLLCLVASLRLLEMLASPLGRSIASLLTVPIAVGFAIGVVGTTLLLVGTYFPVPSEAEISIATLQVAGNLGIVLGSMFALFGVVLGLYNVLAARSLATYTRIAIGTALVPLGVGIALVTRTAIFGNGSETVFDELSGQVWTIIVSPEPPHLHLASFLLVFTFASGALWVLIVRSPTDDLLADWNLDTRTYKRAKTALKVPNILTIIAATLAPAALLVEIAESPAEIEALLGSGLYSTIQVITLATWLRVGLLAIGMFAFGWVVATYIFRESNDHSGAFSAWWLAPLTGGFVITLGAASVAERTFEWIVEETVTQLPAPVSAEFFDISMAVSDTYGETAIVIVLAGILVGLTAWISLLLWVAVYFGYLANEGTGFSLACVGLFIAAVSASIIDAPTWLVLGGIVCSLAVLDIGRFGTRLGREIGSRQTRSLDFVRAGSTLSVGVVAAVAAVGASAFLSGGSFAVTSVTTLALVCLTMGLLFLSLALR